MNLLDTETDELITVYLFVGTLPYSQYIYVETTLDMKSDTWLRCHMNMFEHFGGTTNRLSRTRIYGITFKNSMYVDVVEAMKVDPFDKNLLHKTVVGTVK